MIAVLFEAWPTWQGKKQYASLAAHLKSELETVEGFVSVERFQSLTDPDKLLSLSFFRDENAVAAWRSLSAHRMAQAAGRGGVFSDYRLRVAQVVRNYGLSDREEAPSDSRVVHAAVENDHV
ncbi:antibiotic biosynthesis monooxygenase [Gluconobacter cerinus]